MNTLPTLPPETRNRARAIAEELLPVLQYWEQTKTRPEEDARAADALRPIVRANLAFFNEIAAEVVNDAESCAVWLVSNYVGNEASCREFIGQPGGVIHKLRQAPQVVANCLAKIDEPEAVILAATLMQRIFNWAACRLCPELMVSLMSGIRRADERGS